MPLKFGRKWVNGIFQTKSLKNKFSYVFESNANHQHAITDVAGRAWTAAAGASWWQAAWVMMGEGDGDGGCVG